MISLVKHVFLSHFLDLKYYQTRYKPSYLELSREKCNKIFLPGIFLIFFCWYNINEFRLSNFHIFPEIYLLLCIKAWIKSSLGEVLLKQKWKIADFWQILFSVCIFQKFILVPWHFRLKIGSSITQIHNETFIIRL